MGFRSRSKSLCAALLFSAACTTEPQLVASNCEMGEGCLRTAALKLDAVDILLVMDDSASVADKVDQLKTELPHLLEAITTGESDGVSFPPAKSVHVAVTTTDMGGAVIPPSCTYEGQDGVFLQPGDRGVTCNMAYPGYLAYTAEDGASPMESASCVPLVFPDSASDTGWRHGCGYEQPLEATLKSVWPKADDSLMFRSGYGHGDEKNAGFLRDNSVLVVVIVTDEDDCSITESDFLESPQNAKPQYANQPVSLRCYLNPDKLQAPARYIESLKNLRPNNDNVIFALIAGVPPELVSDDFRSHYDFEAPKQVDQYFADVLTASDMQEKTIEEDTMFGRLAPACTRMVDGSAYSATPPRRLVEVARGFGAQGVLGSICANDFGNTTGHIIRALAEKLTANADR